MMYRLQSLLIAAMVASDAKAVLYGEPERGKASSTVRLAIERHGRADAAAAPHSGSGMCSGTVVGGRPLTVMTAAHCLRDVRFEGTAESPALRLQAADSARLAEARLRAVASPPFATVERNLAEDVAVLVFDVQVDNSVEVLPVAPAERPATVRICGYGIGAREPDSGLPRCAAKRVLAATENFYQFVPKVYEDSDPTLFLQFRAQFESKAAVVSRLAALLAVNRLDARGLYSTTEPMPVRGDSGGPWIASNAEGASAVVAVTSFVETFYRKSTVWHFFQETGLALTDYPYVAYGVRLDTPEARARIEQARRMGADIRESAAASPSNHLGKISAVTSSQR